MDWTHHPTRIQHTINTTISSRGMVRLSWSDPCLPNGGVRASQCRVYGVVLVPVYDDDNQPTTWISAEQWLPSDSMFLCDGLDRHTRFLVHTHALAPWNQPEAYALEIESSIRTHLDGLFDSSVSMKCIHHSVFVHIQAIEDAWFWLYMSIQPIQWHDDQRVWRIVPRKRKCIDLFHPGLAHLAFDTPFDALFVYHHLSNRQVYKITARPRPVDTPCLDWTTSKNTCIEWVDAICAAPVSFLSSSARVLCPLVVLSCPHRACVSIQTRRVDCPFSSFFLFMQS